MDPAPVDFHALPLDKRLEFSLRSPAPFFVTGEEGLQLSGWSVNTSNRLTVSGRFMNLAGEISPFVYDVLLTSNRVVASRVIALGDGWILNLTASTGATTCTYGQCFGRVQVVRGLGSSGIVLGTLCAGYITSSQPIAFPGGRVRSMVEGPAQIRSITGTNPAAGAEVSETVPTGARWRLIALAVRFVTSATAANRFPILTFDDGTNVFFRADPPTQQTAGVDIGYVGGIGVERLTSTNDVRQWGFPVAMPLLAGYRIRTATAFIEADDNWGAPQLLVEEWLEGA